MNPIRAKLWSGPYVLVEGEQIVGIIARLKALEPGVVCAVGASQTALSLALHVIHVGAIFHRKERRFINAPLKMYRERIYRGPVGRGFGATTIAGF
jgi:hypothetical protein